MSGDLYASGAAGSNPLPPAFSQRPIRAPEPGADDERLQPPFFPAGAAAPLQTPAPQAGWELPTAAAAQAAAEVPAPLPTPATGAAPGRVTLESPLRGQVPPREPAEPAFGGLPTDAIFLPDAAIPKRPAASEEDHDLRDPRRRPVSASDLAVLVAARLELFARRLRERGSQGLAESFSGDPLDLALAGLISGYIAGRGG